MTNWDGVDVAGEPRFLLGQRKSSKRIEVWRVDVHQDLFVDLRSIAQGALAELQRREAKPYSTFAAMTGDDYFDVDVSDIPQRRNKRKKEDDPEAYEISSALRMIADCDNHPVMSAEDLREAEPTLYAIVYESNGKYLGFVRNAPPRRRVRPGLKYLQYGNALKRVSPPDLAIDDLVDLVVTEDRCAVLNPNAFTTLFGDVGVAFQQVPKNVDAVSKAVKDAIPFSPETISALTARCGRRVIDARRLHHIVTERQAALKALTPEEMRTLLDRRGLGDSVQEDQLVLDQDAVSEFLDLIEPTLRRRRDGGGTAGGCLFAAKALIPSRARGP